MEFAAVELLPPSNDIPHRWLSPRVWYVKGAP